MMEQDTDELPTQQHHVPPQQEQVEEAPVATMVANTTPRTRLKWHPITMQQEGSVRGVSKIIHPFLIHHRDNWMDVMLVRSLIVEQPFAASFGKAGLAWREFASVLSSAVDPDGNLVYGILGINEKGAKKRFEDLMAYVKKKEGEVPFQSGCDDLAPSTELESGLESLYEIHTEILSSIKVASTSTAAHKAADKEKAETLRNASLGLITPQDKIKLKTRTSSSSRSSGCASASSTSATKKRNSSAVVDLMESAVERLTYRRESHVAKEARKKARQDAKALEREREFNFKVEATKEANEMKKIQLEINMEMLRYLRKQN
jgi:hypothetical protein